MSEVYEVFVGLVSGSEVRVRITTTSSEEAIHLARVDVHQRGLGVLAPVMAGKDRVFRISAA